MHIEQLKKKKVFSKLSMNGNMTKEKMLLLLKFSIV